MHIIPSRPCSVPASPGTGPSGSCPSSLGQYRLSAGPDRLFSWGRNGGRPIWSRPCQGDDPQVRMTAAPLQCHLLAIAARGSGSWILETLISTEAESGAVSDAPAGTTAILWGGSCSHLFPPEERGGEPGQTPVRRKRRSFAWRCTVVAPDRDDPARVQLGTRGIHTRDGHGTYSWNLGRPNLCPSASQGHPRQLHPWGAPSHERAPSEEKRGDPLKNHQDPTRVTEPYPKYHWLGP